MYWIYGLVRSIFGIYFSVILCIGTPVTLQCTYVVMHDVSLLHFMYKTTFFVV